MERLDKIKYNLSILDFNELVDRCIFIDIIVEYLNLDNYINCIDIFINKYYFGDEKYYLINLSNNIFGDLSNRIILYNLLSNKLIEIINNEKR